MQTLTDIDLDEEKVAAGFKTFDSYCGPCHGAGAVGGGVVPDLRYSAFLQSPEGWLQVVREGLLASRGMASFAQELSTEDAEAVRQYVISRNQFAHSIGDIHRVSR
jgi:mono/diheme cytochrome c family protein